MVEWKRVSQGVLAIEAAIDYFQESFATTSVPGDEESGWSPPGTRRHQGRADQPGVRSRRHGECSMAACLEKLRRRKVFADGLESTQLARVLSTMDLTALGVGSTLGVGVYVLAGSVSRTTAGPAVVLSFLIAAIASVFAGLCYAEFGARVPRAGSAYIYSYVCVGELVAFIIGWNLVLEYVIGAASVGRGLSTYVDALIGNVMQKEFRRLAPINISFMSPYPDFFAFAVVNIFAGALSLGVKESTNVNNIFTILNITVILYVIITGAFKADPKNWSLPKDEVPESAGEGGFLPYGIAGMVKGAATCFYGFVGFDCIATSGYLLGALFPLPRVIYAMANDGLIFRFLGKVHPRFQTPLLGTLLAGLLTGLMASLFDLQHLVDMMSIGTLMAYSIVAACVMLLRYEENDTPKKPAPKRNRESVGNKRRCATVCAHLKDLMFLVFNLHGYKTPNKLTASLVAWEVFAYFAMCIGVTAVAVNAEEAIWNAEALPLFFLVLFGSCLILLMISITLQPVSKKFLTFKVKSVRNMLVSYHVAFAVNYQLF
ncbi:hypothetical protein PR048_000617 [Dryococelus australis]|uniref:Cationic amino acid transporter 2 n=1 Tax=Dryococelus australis TaxID=614101 RepID=A0ABQ9IF52_9NEOP|nr:hypothetical protein PR048_000617 [Dryococelus australis]